MKLIDKLKEIRGNQVVAELKIFGIQIFRISKTNAIHTNVFLLYIPLFRIVKSKEQFGIHLLVIVWIYKFLVALGNNLRIAVNKDTFICRFGKKALFEFTHNDRERAFKIAGKNIIGSYRYEPFKFPSAIFKG